MTTFSRPEEETVELSIDDTWTTLRHPAVKNGTLKVATEIFANKFFGVSPESSGLLPPVVRYVTPDYKGFMLEQVPTIAKINYHGNKRSKSDPGSWEVPIPWTVILLSFGKDIQTLNYMQVYARPSAITSIEDEFYILPLTNIYDQGNVCLNDTMGALKMLENDADTASYLRCAVNTFWAANFNLDLTYFITSGNLPEPWKGLRGAHDGDGSVYPAVLDEWSKLDLEQALDFPWTKSPTTTKTVADAMKKLNSDFERRKKVAKSGGEANVLKFINTFKRYFE